MVASPLIVDIHSSYQVYDADMVRTIFLDEKLREPIELYEVFRERVHEMIHSLKVGIDLLEFKKRFYEGLDDIGDWILLTGPLLHGIGVVNFEIPKFDHSFEGKGYPWKLEACNAHASTNIGLYSRQGWVSAMKTHFLSNQKALIFSPIKYLEIIDIL